MKREQIYISTKFDYYIGIIVFVGSTIFSVVLSFLVVDSGKSDGEILFYIFTILSTYFFLKTFQYFSKNIYATIDIEAKQFRYGSVFLQEEIETKKVKFIRKALIGKTIIVDISGKRFRLLLSRGISKDDVRQYIG